MEKTFSISVNVSHEFSIEDLSNILVTAFEGGINYWCGSVRMVRSKETGKYKNVSHEDQVKIKYASDLIGYGGELVLVDAEDSEEKWKLTLEKLLKGITIYCESNNVPLCKLMDDYDADTADSIVQYALFNELVFG